MDKEIEILIYAVMFLINAVLNGWLALKVSMGRGFSIFISMLNGSFCILYIYVWLFGK